MVLCTVEFDGKVRTCFEALTDLLVREQFLSVCSIEMALFKREKVPQNTEVMTTLADHYIEAHGGCTVLLGGQSRRRTLQLNQGWTVCCTRLTHLSLQSPNSVEARGNASIGTRKAA